LNIGAIFGSGQKTPKLDSLYESPTKVQNMCCGSKDTEHNYNDSPLKTNYKESPVKTKQASYEYLHVINLKSYFYIIDSLIYTCDHNHKIDHIIFAPNSQKVVAKIIKDNSAVNFNKTLCEDTAVKNLMFEFADVLKNKHEYIPKNLLGDYKGYFEHIEKFKLNSNVKKLITINDKKTYLWLKRSRDQDKEKKLDWVLDWSNVDLDLGFNNVTANNVLLDANDDEYKKLLEENGVIISQKSKGE